MARGGWKPTVVSGGDKEPASPTPARSRRQRQPPPEDTSVIAPEPTRPRELPEPGNRNVPRPGQLNVRLGVRWSRIVADVKAGEYSWQEFVERLDPEELARGQLKDGNGGWRGRPPALVPREFHLACQRELKRRFEEMFSGKLLVVADEFLKLAMSPAVDVKTRAGMLKYAMERIMGGIPREFKVSAEAPYEAVLAYISSGEGDDAVPEWQARRDAGYRERLGEGSDAE